MMLPLFFAFRHFAAAIFFFAFDAPYGAGLRFAIVSLMFAISISARYFAATSTLADYVAYWHSLIR